MKEFNIVVCGIGGQGAITLANIIAEAALKQGYSVRASEVHGLAMRGGPIVCHVRFGSDVHSPLVLKGEAHLIIGLELLETLRACYYGSKESKSVFLLDNYKVIPLSVSILKEKYPSTNEIVKKLKNFGTRIILVNGAEKIKKEGLSTIFSNVYLLGYAIKKKLIPLSKKTVLAAIEDVVPENMVEVNKRIFNLA